LHDVGTGWCQPLATLATVEDQGHIRVAGVPFAPGTEVEVRISPRMRSEAEVTQADAAAVAAARVRGAKIGKHLLAVEGQPLSAAEVCKHLQRSAADVEGMRTAGRLLAVEAEKKGHVFPSWQFAENGLLPGIEEVLGELKNLSPWTQLQFFLNADLRLDGASPLEELRNGKVADVRRAARNYGEQGAA
jgi:hypothetical protein